MQTEDGTSLGADSVTTLSDYMKYVTLTVKLLPSL